MSADSSPAASCHFSHDVEQMKNRTAIRFKSPISSQRCLHRCRRGGSPPKAARVDHNRLRGSGQPPGNPRSCPPDKSRDVIVRVGGWRTPAVRRPPAAPVRTGVRNRSPWDRPRAAAVTAPALPPAAQRPLPTSDCETKAPHSASAKVCRLRRGERRDVLILGGAKRIEDPGYVQDRGDVGAVVAVAELRRVARLHCQVAARVPRSVLRRSKCCGRRSI